MAKFYNHAVVRTVGLIGMRMVFIERTMPLFDVEYFRTVKIKICTDFQNSFAAVKRSKLTTKPI